jgi:hypothetical protein
VTLRATPASSSSERSESTVPAALARALAQATQHLSPAGRERVAGIFQVLCSAPAWQILHERAHLDGESAAQALDWALRTLLSALYAEQSKTLK